MLKSGIDKSMQLSDLSDLDGLFASESWKKIEIGENKLIPSLAPNIHPPYFPDPPPSPKPVLSDCSLIGGHATWNQQIGFGYLHLIYNKNYSGMH